MAAAEKGLHKHDQALARLSVGLEDWLTGRTSLEAMKSTIASVKVEVAKPTRLPSPVASKVSKAEQALVGSVASFCAEKSPDQAGQRALFERLNSSIRDRSSALLEWRSTTNRQLAAVAKKGSGRARYLAWEGAWLPLWKAEVDITYRLQKSVLTSAKSEQGQSPAFVRELLGVQTKASAIAAPKELAPLQEQSLRRLTLLARTAEQIDRLGRGESRGALTRVRRLNKEQTELGRLLQEQRLTLLATLAK